MISSVSFKGLYTINRAQNRNFDHRACLAYDYFSGYKGYQDIADHKDYYTFRIPDNCDSKAKLFMLLRGIKFFEHKPTALKSEKSIKHRIILFPPLEKEEEEYEIVEVKADKFDKNFKEHGFGYIDANVTDDLSYRTDRFDKFLEEGTEIYASDVSVQDDFDSPQIMFNDGRHRYAYYRDMGMKTIPVSMNKASIEVARKYGLLAE